MERLRISKEYLDYLNSFLPKNYTLGEENVSMTNEIIEDLLMRSYRDMIKFHGTKELFFMVALDLLSGYYQIPEQKVNAKLIEKTFNNPLLKNAEPNSEYFAVMKDMTELYEQLNEAIDNNESYKALIIYKKILKFLSEETLSKYKGDELEKECAKRYAIGKNTARHYQTRMRLKKMKPYDKFDITLIPRMQNASHTCVMLKKYFHQKMLSYYQKCGYMYAPVSDTLDFYKLGKINMVTYTYDDELPMFYNKDGKKYKWDSYEFWALLFQDDPSISFDLGKFKKLVDNDEPLIIAPNTFMEEAFLKYVMHNNGIDENSSDLKILADKIGFPLNHEKTDKLLTKDYLTFYKDPKEVKKLKVSDIAKYKTLQNILAKKNDERAKYINRLKSTYKGQNKIKDIIDENTNPRERRKVNPKAWWND